MSSSTPNTVIGPYARMVEESPQAAASGVIIDITPRDTRHLTPLKLPELSKRILNLFPLDPPVTPGTYLPPDFLARQDLILMQLSERTITDATGRILANAEPTEGVQSVIDERSWDDLSLVAGSKANPGACVAETIKRTRTIAGKLFFNARVSRPTDDLDVIRNRQEVVKELTKPGNKALIDTLLDLLKLLQENEKQMVSFWNPKGQMLPGRADKYFSRLSEGIDRQINESPRLLTVHASMEVLKTAVQTALVSTAIIAMPLYVISQTGAFGDGDFSDQLQAYNARFSGSAGPLYLMASLIPSAIAKGAASIVGGGVAALTVKHVCQWNLVELKFDQMIHKKLLGVATYYRTAKQIYLKLAGTAIADQLEHFGKLSQFMADPTLQTLFGALESRTFNGDAGWFYQRGNVLYSWRQLENPKVKKSFEMAILALAEIDTVLGTAKLFEEESNRYCFPSFIEGAKTPSLEIADYIHPMVAKDKAVANSIAFGDQALKNLIVTGPNAAGKSTNLRAILTAVIMAQSLGIAPAHQMSLTPFGRITSSMCTTDNVGNGDSLFQAQLKQANQLIANVEKTPHIFTLAALDELFNGSNRYEGPAFAFATAERLGQFPNSITLFATHFVHNIPKLAVTDYWDNYCVARENGKPTYLLSPGISREFEGVAVAQELDFDAAALRSAKAEKQRLQAEDEFKAPLD